MLSTHSESGRRKMNSGAQHAFAFSFYPGPGEMGCPSVLGWVYPAQLSLSRNSLIDTPREVFP